MKREREKKGFCLSGEKHGKEGEAKRGGKGFVILERGRGKKRVLFL